MSDDGLSEFGDLEHEFTQEEKSNGSLSPHIVGDPAAESVYIGYDIRPENIEALYFDGIGIPRWESIKADNVDQQKAIYMEAYNKQTSAYPLISRMNDTDQKVTYSSDEVLQLRSECDRVMAGASDPKAILALQKLSLAANKAAAQQMGLEFIPG